MADDSDATQSATTELEAWLIDTFDALADAVYASAPGPRDESGVAWLREQHAAPQHLIALMNLYAEVTEHGFALWYANGYHGQDGAQAFAALARMVQRGQQDAGTFKRLRTLLRRVEDRLMRHAANHGGPDAARSVTLSGETLEALTTCDDDFYTFSHDFYGECARYFTDWHWQDALAFGQFAGAERLRDARPGKPAPSPCEPRSGKDHKAA